jgi:hypothetical protein
MIAKSRSLRTRVGGRHFVLGLVPVLLIASVVSAQEMPVDAITKGSFVVATRDVTLRDAPPRPGLIYERGHETGTLKAGERAEVKDVSIFRTALFGEQKWIGLRVGGRMQWAFAGSVGATSCCFRPGGR